MQPHKPTPGHDWDDDRCTKCGAKDWMGVDACDGDRPRTINVVPGLIDEPKGLSPDDVAAWGELAAITPSVFAPDSHSAGHHDLIMDEPLLGRGMDHGEATKTLLTIDSIVLDPDAFIQREYIVDGAVQIGPPLYARNNPAVALELKQAILEKANAAPNPYVTASVGRGLLVPVRYTDADGTETHEADGSLIKPVLDNDFQCVNLGAVSPATEHSNRSMHCTRCGLNVDIAADGVITYSNFVIDPKVRGANRVLRKEYNVGLEHASRFCVALDVAYQLADLKTRHLSNDMANLAVIADSIVTAPVVYADDLTEATAWCKELRSTSDELNVMVIQSPTETQHGIYIGLDPNDEDPSATVEAALVEYRRIRGNTHCMVMMDDAPFLPVGDTLPAGTDLNCIDAPGQYHFESTANAPTAVRNADGGQSVSLVSIALRRP